jgi:hypothetical protein
MQRIEFRAGTYTTCLSLASAGALVIWPSQAWIGYGLFAAAIAFAISGFQFKGVPLADMLKGKEAWRVAYAERSEFEQEVVCINDLVNDAVPHVVGKRFKRCIIRGPARVWLRDANRLDYSSAPDLTLLVEVPADADMTGTVVFRNTVFDRCFFEDLFIEFDAINYNSVAPHILPQSLAEWKRLRHYGGARM